MPTYNVEFFLVLSLSGLKRVSTSELGKTEDFTKEVLHRPLTIKTFTGREGWHVPSYKGQEDVLACEGKGECEQSLVGVVCRHREDEVGGGGRWGQASEALDTLITALGSHCWVKGGSPEVGLFVWLMSLRHEPDNYLYVSPQHFIPCICFFK